MTPFSSLTERDNPLKLLAGNYPDQFVSGYFLFRNCVRALEGKQNLH